MQRSFVTLATVLVVALAAQVSSVSTASAQPTPGDNELDTDSRLVQSGGPRVRQTVTDTFASDRVFSSLSSAVGNIEYTAQGEAGFGWARSESFVRQAAEPTTSERYQVSNRSRWRENGLIISGGQGLFGFLNGSVTIDGIINAQRDPGTEFEATVQVLGQGFNGATVTFPQIPAGWGVEGPLGAGPSLRTTASVLSLIDELVVPFQIRFRWNVPFDLQFGLGTQIEWFDRAGPVLAENTVRLAFGNTLKWNGITSLTDASGTALPLSLLPTGTAFDLTSAVVAPAPIPEPANVAMLLAGLGVVVAIQRRRSARRALVA